MEMKEKKKAKVCKCRQKVSDGVALIEGENLYGKAKIRLSDRRGNLKKLCKRLRVNSRVG